jgi:hypothetical protein
VAGRPGAHGVVRLIGETRRVAMPAPGGVEFFGSAPVSRTTDTRAVTGHRHSRETTSTGSAIPLRDTVWASVAGWPDASTVSRPARISPP